VGQFLKVSMVTTGGVLPHSNSMRPRRSAAEFNRSRADLHLIRLCGPANMLISSFSNADVRRGWIVADNQAIPENILSDIPGAITNVTGNVPQSYDLVTFRVGSVQHRTRVAQQVLHMFRY
jgi:hypothetical protein